MNTHQVLFLVLRLIVCGLCCFPVSNVRVNGASVTEVKQVIGGVPLAEQLMLVKGAPAGISSVSLVAPSTLTVTQVGPVPKMLPSPRNH